MADERVLTLEEIQARRPFGLFCDIDGTIAPIVPRPEDARVSERARALLRDVARHADLAAIVTGRSLATARRMVGLDGLTYVGNHGFEWWVDGREVDAPFAAQFRPVMARLADALEAALAGEPGVLVERKGPVVGLHYRLAPDEDAARHRILQALESLDRPDTVGVRFGIRVVELYPQVDVSKGTAVRHLVESRGLASAVFMGDDRTDLDAFRVLQDLRRRGVIAARLVAVRHRETPDAVLEAGDEIVEGVPGVEGFLARLLAVLTRKAAEDR